MYLVSGKRLTRWMIIGAVFLGSPFQSAIANDINDTVPSFAKLDRDAAFEGGTAAWQLFLQKNIRGDIPEQHNAPAGAYKAIARFVVNTDGTVNDVVLIEDPGYGTGEELMRVIKLSSGKWVSASHNSKPVKAYRVQPLVFEVKKDAGGNNGMKTQHIIRNYSFEYFDCYNQLIGWRPQITRPNAYLIKLMTDEVKDGNISVSLVSNPDYTGEKAIGLFNTIILGDVLRGKDSVKVTAYIKTKNVTDGVASIWMQMNGQGRIIRDINFDKSGISGTTDWTRAEISLPVTPDVLSIALGCKFTGKGEAFFDKFSVIVNGIEIE